MNDICQKCSNTGTVKTNLILNNSYVMERAKCSCKNGIKFIQELDKFEYLRKLKAEHDAIDRMTTKEVLQYIRDKIIGKDWAGGMQEIKTSDTCPF